MKLDDRFRSLERTQVPDVWDESRRRQPRALPPRPRARRVVTIAVASVIGVAGVGVAVLALDRGAPTTVTVPRVTPSETSAPQPEDRVARRAAKAAALAEATRLLDLVRVPPGATPVSSAPVSGLRRPPTSPATGYLLDEAAWWSVPRSASSALAWLNAHPPAGHWRSTGGSGVGASGPFVYVGYEGEGSTSYSSATLLIEVVSTGSGTSAIRADGQTVWLPPRPADTLVPGDVTQATIIAYQGPPANVQTQRTLRAAGATKLATLLNGLPVDDRGVHGCSLDTGLRYRVTFPTANGPLVFTGDPACSSVSVTLNGGPATALQDVVDLPRRLHLVVPDGVSSGPIAQSGICAPSDLELRQGPPVSEATGQNSRVLTLTNVSSVLCHLKGYPRIVLEDASGQPIAFRYRYGGDQMVTSRRPVTVALAPGAVAYLMFNKYRCDAGDLNRAVSVKVTPPGDLEARSLSLRTSPDLGYCGPGDPGTRVTVSPIEPRAAAVTAH